MDPKAIPEKTKLTRMHVHKVSTTEVSCLNIEFGRSVSSLILLRFGIMNFSKNSAQPYQLTSSAAVDTTQTCVQSSVQDGQFSLSQRAVNLAAMQHVQSNHLHLVH